MPEFETLFAVGEISVAIAGFSAIVVLFKRSDSGRWRPADADRFNGMLFHAMAAAFFCILPPVLALFTSDAATLWAIASGLLAAQLLAHIAVISGLRSTRWVVRLFLLPGLAVALLLGLNAAALGFAREFRPYLVGILWHVFQAGVLFVSLVVVRGDDAEGERGASD